MGEENSLFIDKISLSSLVIDKKGQLIGRYNDLIYRVGLGEIKRTEVYKDAFSLSVVRTIKDLYDMIKYKKIIELKKKNKEIHPKENEIKALIEKFLDRKERFKLQEINIAYENLLEILALAGYDNDETKKDSDNDDESIHF